MIEGDTKTLIAGGEHALLKILAASHAGMTTEEFKTIVDDWFATARHPRFKRAYTDLVYLPMLELLVYLRENGFKTYVVSGGGVEFMRPWTEKTYGIPPEQVIGSMGGLKYEMRDGRPVLLREAHVDFVDDRMGKAIAIQKFIGRRPIFAAGNSDGDLEMLQWTTSGAGSRFGMLVWHTDAEREYAYDRQSGTGRLDKALDEARTRGWLVVDMKQSWKTIYPFQRDRIPDGSKRFWEAKRYRPAVGATRPAPCSHSAAQFRVTNGAGLTVSFYGPGTPIRMRKKNRRAGTALLSSAVRTRLWTTF